MLPRNQGLCTRAPLVIEMETCKTGTFPNKLSCFASYTPRPCGFHGVDGGIRSIACRNGTDDVNGWFWFYCLYSPLACTVI